MVWLENRTLGKLILTLTSLFFGYYTFWIILLPFVDADYKAAVAGLFPPVELALIIPSVVGSSVFTLLLIRAYHLVCIDRARGVKKLA